MTVDLHGFVPYLNYTTSTAGLYLMVAVPACLVRLAWWYWAFVRESRAKGDAFRVAAADVAAIRDREVSPRTLEYWHEPLCWIHIMMGLLCFRIAPIPALLFIDGFTRRGWLTTGEYMQVLFFAAALALFVWIWLRAVRALWFAVEPEGILFTPGMRQSARMPWEEVSAAAMYGERPVAAVVSGTADDGKEHTVLLYNGFYRRADFEPITVKLLGRREPSPAATTGSPG